MSAVRSSLGRGLTPYMPRAAGARDPRRQQNPLTPRELNESAMAGV